MSRKLLQTAGARFTSALLCLLCSVLAGQDGTLTPGAVLPVDRAEVCTPGYSKAVRRVPESRLTRLLPSGRRSDQNRLERFYARGLLPDIRHPEYSKINETVRWRHPARAWFRARSSRSSALARWMKAIAPLRRQVVRLEVLPPDAARDPGEG
jgi:hypothetical protein